MNAAAIIPRQKKAATKAIKLLPSNAKGIDLSNVDFLAATFAGIDADEVPWVTSFAGDVATADHRVWFGAPAIPMPRFIRPNHNCYMAVSTFKRAEDGKYRRRKDCWSGLWLVLLDDLGTKIPFDALRLEPSCIVETSPKNWQIWYLLQQPERNQIKAQALIDGLIAAGASDPGAGNLTRYGRLPTGINGKTKYAKDGQPFTQRVHVWEPSRRYAPEQIAQAHGFDLTAASKPRPRRAVPMKAAAKGNGYLSTLEAAGLYLEPIRGFHGGHRIVCPWHEAHTDRDQTGTVYFTPDEQNDMRGGFKCQHAHCVHRTITDFDYFIVRLLAARGAA